MAMASVEQAAEKAGVRIREERPGDEAAIRRVHLDAFPEAAEADLVDRLRLRCATRFSFVAVEGENGGSGDEPRSIVGHILFTPTRGRAGDREVEGMGLAPMAVLASHQRRGLGGALIRHGALRVKAAGYPFIIVLGHPEYYPRFGFERASRFGVRSEFPNIPDEVFMLMPLDEAVVHGLSGVVRYRPEFSEP